MEQDINLIVADLMKRITALEASNIQTQTTKSVLVKHLQVLDARNIQLGKTTGTKIGTESTQKLAFFGATPVVRQNAISAPGGGGTTDTDAIDQSARTAINSIRGVLTNFGLTS